MPLIANILPLLISHIFPITPLTSRNPLLQYSSRKEKKKKNKEKNVSRHHANEIPRYRNLFQFNVNARVRVKRPPFPLPEKREEERRKTGKRNIRRNLLDIPPKLNREVKHAR